MKIDWDNEDLLDYDIRKQMSIAAEKAVLCEGIRSECAIHVCLCDDDMITDINQKYRGISSSTDVLSLWNMMMKVELAFSEISLFRFRM